MASTNDVTMRQLFDRTSCTYTYLLMDNETKEALLIDPVLECVDRDLEAVEGMGANLKLVLNTHVHADHITGSGKLKSLISGLQSVVSKASGAVADILVNDGDKVEFGRSSLVVASTPGHTPGCVTYVLHNGPATKAFTGDTLLIRGCGRTDFQGGSPATLFESVTKKIFEALPPTTVIHPGHDYSGRTATTVLEEMTHNPRIGPATGATKESFIALMEKRFDGSKYPGAIDQALPANMVCGVYGDGKFDPATSEPVAHPGGFVWVSTKAAL